MPRCYVYDAEESARSRTEHSETGGPEEAHLAEHRLRTAGQGDPSNPNEALSCPRVVAAPIPKQFPDARTRAVPAPILRSAGCPQKQPSPYIRKVQYTVLSVAGLKGTMSEFELNLLRQRSIEAIRQKAQRGELKYCLPAGYLWTTNGKIEMDPDQRVRQVLGSVFAKFTELGSVRQVLLWFRRERIELPTTEQSGGRTVWKLPIYNIVLKILSNPIYAGAYAFGKTHARTSIVDGRARKTTGHKKARCEWTVLLRDHHSGYISWEQYDHNQAMIAANAHMKSRMGPQAGRGGKALLSGLLRCRRCGRMLHVSYTGRHSVVLRYQCKGAHINHGEDWCISFGGLRTDQAVADEILRAIGGNAVEAALEAADKMRQQRQEQRRSLELELEQARYEAKLAARRYEAVDPDNRLVAAELELRWNAALRKAGELQDRLCGFDLSADTPTIPEYDGVAELGAGSARGVERADHRHAAEAEDHANSDQRDHCRR